MNNVQDLVDFNILGLDIENYLSDEDKVKFHNIVDELQKCYKEKEELLKKKDNLNDITFSTVYGKTFTRKRLVLDQYDLDIQKALLKNIKYFKNKENKRCEIVSSSIYNGKIYVSLKIGADKKYPTFTKMSLDRFLQLYEEGDFTLVVNTEDDKKDFRIDKSVKDLQNQIKVIDEKIKDIKNSKDYQSFVNLYNEKKNEVNKNYASELGNETRQIGPDKASLERKQKLLTDKIKNIKDIWIDTLNKAEQAETIGWICRHINKITIKVVEGGVSDKVISRNYPDEIYGPKYKEKANSSGWDASSGYLYFDDISKAPIDYLRRLSTAKHIFRTKDGGQTVFQGNKISNLDLALFLLGNYNQYGFRSGENNLNMNIDTKQLVNDCFPENKEDFYRGYSPEDNPFEEE